MANRVGPQLTTRGSELGDARAKAPFRRPVPCSRHFLADHFSFLPASGTMGVVSAAAFCTETSLVANAGGQGKRRRGPAIPKSQSTVAANVVNASPYESFPKHKDLKDLFCLSSLYISLHATTSLLS